MACVFSADQPRQELHSTQFGVCRIWEAHFWPTYCRRLRPRLKLLPAGTLDDLMCTRKPHQGQQPDDERLAQRRIAVNHKRQSAAHNCGLNQVPKRHLHDLVPNPAGFNSGCDRPSCGSPPPTSLNSAAFARKFGTNSHRTQGRSPKSAFLLFKRQLVADHFAG